uniref:Uncharacterized protein n=1 Tax=Lactuca sativa TaxID=4236 RepID=A0A9R1UJ25_LACSA|nr:hypothetical protein LSAT_V11C900484430 [Lactuca sativa]
MPLSLYPNLLSNPLTTHLHGQLNHRCPHICQHMVAKRQRPRCSDSDIVCVINSIDPKSPFSSMLITQRMIMLLGPPSSRMWINRFVESTFRNLNKSLKILNSVEKRRSSFTNKDSHMFDFLMNGLVRSGVKGRAKYMVSIYSEKSSI